MHGRPAARPHRPAGPPEPHLGTCPAEGTPTHPQRGGLGQPGAATDHRLRRTNVPPAPRHAEDPMGPERP
eukprot:12588572-Alexandrium_andersonii.AAC.1